MNDIDDIPLRARSILYLLELSKKNNSDQMTNVTANIWFLSLAGSYFIG